MEEKLLFEKDGVQVTNARFKVNAQTYAIRNITSTEVWTSPQKWMLGALALAIAVALLADRNYGGALLVGAAGAVALHAGRPKHHVKLRTSAGEAMALESRDREYVVAIVNALNEAMVSQHRSAA